MKIVVLTHIFLINRVTVYFWSVLAQFFDKLKKCEFYFCKVKFKSREFVRSQTVGRSVEPWIKSYILGFVLISVQTFRPYGLDLFGDYDEMVKYFDENDEKRNYDPLTSFFKSSFYPNYQKRNIVSDAKYKGVSLTKNSVPKKDY